MEQCYNERLRHFRPRELLERSAVSLRVNMPQQQRVSGPIPAAIDAKPKYTHSKVVRGGGVRSATRSGSAEQLDLGRPEEVLAALCRGSPESDKAIEHIASMQQGTLRTTYLGETRSKRLHSLAQCLGAGDSRSKALQLATLSALKLDKRDLADSGLQQQLRPLCSSAATAVAKLAKKILDWQEAKPESARYWLGRHL